MNSRSRWMTIAAVAAVAAAGGAAWGVRRGRGAAPPSPAAAPSPPVPSVARPPARAAGVLTRRRVVVAVAGVLAAAGAVAVVATHIDQPAGLAGQARVVTTYAPVRTPPLSVDAWVPGPTSAAWATPSAPPSAGPPTPVPVGGVLPPNGRVKMRGDSGEEMTVSVVRIANPAPAYDSDHPGGPAIEPRVGYRMVRVSIVIENTGGVPFLDDLERYTWLVDRGGKTYPRSVALTDDRQLHPASVLPPESLNGRTIYFEVRGDVEPARFRLSLHPNSARQTQDWLLG